jgi:hypothetical protein
MLSLTSSRFLRLSIFFIGILATTIALFGIGRKPSAAQADQASSWYGRAGYDDAINAQHLNIDTHVFDSAASSSANVRTVSVTPHFSFPPVASSSVAVSTKPHALLQQLSSPSKNSSTASSTAASSSTTSHSSMNTLSPQMINPPRSSSPAQKDESQSDPPAPEPAAPFEQPMSFPDATQSVFKKF